MNKTTIIEVKLTNIHGTGFAHNQEVIINTTDLVDAARTIRDAVALFHNRMMPAVAVRTFVIYTDSEGDYRYDRDQHMCTIGVKAPGAPEELPWCTKYVTAADCNYLDPIPLVRWLELTQDDLKVMQDICMSGNG